MAKNDQFRLEETQPVKWPQDKPHTLIEKRREARQWKKQFPYYRDKLAQALRRVGAAEIVLTYNAGDAARRDPGVAVYFARAVKAQDFSWQSALGLDNPAPTLKEIDDAFRDKAMKFHPDRPGGDVAMYRQMVQHRENAKRWILNKLDEMPELVLWCDTFTEIRWNVAALAFGIAALHKLEEFGLPHMVEGAFRGFRTQIEHKSGESNGERIITN